MLHPWIRQVHRLSASGRAACTSSVVTGCAGRTAIGWHSSHVTSAKDGSAAGISSYDRGQERCVPCARWGHPKAARHCRGQCPRADVCTAVPDHPGLTWSGCLCQVVRGTSRCSARRVVRRVRRLVIKVIAAHVINDSLISGSRSWSRQCRQARMIHDHERSTTHLRGRTTKPFASGGRRTVLMVMSR